MARFLKNLHRDDSGQDLIEYAMVALIVAFRCDCRYGQPGSIDQRRVQQDL